MPNDISDNKHDTDLVFSFEGTFVPALFDDEKTHGMSHSMKSVDFIVTSPGQTWLIEVKDPENRNIPQAYQEQQHSGFLDKITTGTLFSDELAPKLKDTLLYLTLQHRAPENEIRYVVCIGFASFDAAMLLNLQDELKRHLKLLPGPFGKPWNSHFDAVVLNMAAWNAQLSPHSVRRQGRRL